MKYLIPISISTISLTFFLGELAEFLDLNKVLSAYFIGSLAMIFYFSVLIAWEKQELIEKPTK